MLLDLSVFSSHASGETYELAQPSQKATKLNDGPNAFQYSHVYKADFLSQVSVVNLKPEEIMHTLMYSSLVYSGSLTKGINIAPPAMH